MDLRLNNQTPSEIEAYLQGEEADFISAGEGPRPLVAGWLLLVMGLLWTLGSCLIPIAILTFTLMGLKIGYTSEDLAISPYAFIGLAAMALGIYLIMKRRIVWYIGTPSRLILFQRGRFTSNDWGRFQAVHHTDPEAGSLILALRSDPTERKHTPSHVTMRGIANLPAVEEACRLRIPAGSAPETGAGEEHLPSLNEILGKFQNPKGGKPVPANPGAGGHKGGLMGPETSQPASLLLKAVILLAGVALIIIGGGRLFTELTAVVTEGEIIRSGHQGDGTPFVLYRYTVDGAEYSGQRLTLHGSGGGGPGKSTIRGRALAERYPAGAKVKVHYPRERPEAAYLIPNYLEPIFILAGGIVFAGLAGAAIFFPVPLPGRRRWEK